MSTVSSNRSNRKSLRRTSSFQLPNSTADVTKFSLKASVTRRQSNDEIKASCLKHVVKDRPDSDQKSPKKKVTIFSDKNESRRYASDDEAGKEEVANQPAKYLFNLCNCNRVGRAATISALKKKNKVSWA